MIGPPAPAFFHRRPSLILSRHREHPSLTMICRSEPDRRRPRRAGAAAQACAAVPCRLLPYRSAGQARPVLFPEFFRLAPTPCVSPGPPLSLRHCSREGGACPDLSGNPSPPPHPPGAVQMQAPRGSVPAPRPPQHPGVIPPGHRPQNLPPADRAAFPAPLRSSVPRLPRLSSLSCVFPSLFSFHPGAGRLMPLAGVIGLWYCAGRR